MKERTFYKLVRDLIPDIIRENGEEAITRVLDDDEYRTELYRKLKEECDEVLFSSSKEQVLEELADVYEVISAIASLEGKQISDVSLLAEEKRKKRGGFQKRIFLERTLLRK